MLGKRCALTLLVVARALFDPLFGGSMVVAQPVTDQEAVCSDCHACRNPTKADPCLHLCPRPLARRDIEHSPATIILNELEFEYGPVMFNHRLHADMSAMGGKCGDCHHRRGGRPIGACKECHPAGEVKDMHQPSLKAAYHRQCMNCHSEWSGVTSCEMCHVKKAVPGPAAETALPKVARVSRRFFPHIEQPEKKVWRSSHDGGTIVTFFHRNHSENYGISCAACHHAEGCGSCHRKGATAQRVRHSEEALHAICNSCHSEMSCKQCHLKVEAQPFSHDRTGWLLGKYHQRAACRSCHGDPHHFEKPPRACNSCHSHWTPATFDHARTGLELSEVHQETDCAACHQQRVFDAAPTCAACHESSIAYPAQLPGRRMERRH